MRRYWRSILAVAFLVAGGWLLWPLRPHADPVTWANTARVHPAMTRDEVVAILGEPGDYRSGPTEARAILRPEYSIDGELWQGDRVELRIRFDYQNRVDAVQCKHVDPAYAGPLALLRWRIDPARRD